MATDYTIEINSCEDLIEFMTTTINNYSNYIVNINNDLDFIDYGVIDTQWKIASGSTQSNVSIDLHGHTIKNLYPIFISMIIAGNYCLEIKNGAIENILINTGSIISISSLFDYTSEKTYKEAFSTVHGGKDQYFSKYPVRFKNVAFSVLGCNFKDTRIDAASIISYEQGKENWGMLKAFLFESCSFYIRAFNAEPFSNMCMFMNCSFYYDVEYKKIDFFKHDSNNPYCRHNTYCFCTFSGKIKKSPDYIDVTDSIETLLGCVYNSYFNVETDVEKPLFIAVNANAIPHAAYVALHHDSYNTDISDYSFDPTTVYNKEKYLSEIVEGKNCTPVLGATALTDAEMHDENKLLRVGLLAVNLEETT